MCWTHWCQGWAQLHSPEPQAGVAASDDSSDIIRVLIMVDSWRGRRRNKGAQLWPGALDLAQLDLHVMLSLVGGHGSGWQSNGSRHADITHSSADGVPIRSPHHAGPARSV